MTTFDESDAIYVRELGIDDIAPVYHLGEELWFFRIFYGESKK